MTPEPVKALAAARTADEVHQRETDRLEARLWTNDEAQSLAGYRQLAFDAISLLKDSTYRADPAPRVPDDADTIIAAFEKTLLEHDVTYEDFAEVVVGIRYKRLLADIDARVSRLNRDTGSAEPGEGPIE